MMKNRSTRAHKSLIWLVAVSLAAASLSACGGAPTKSDDKKIEEVRRTQVEEAVEQTGLQKTALEAFQSAIVELESEKPDTSKALKLLSQAVELEPTFAEAHYNLGLVYTQLGEREDAVRHLKLARDLDPDFMEYTVALAQAYAINENYSDAEQLFNEVVAREPTNLTAKNNLAVLALKKGDDEKALEYVREILREDEKNVGALNTLGLVYRKQKNLSLARFVFDKALETDKSNVDVLNNLGLVYMEEENVPAAVNAFNRAIEADPNYLESRLNLGAILIEYLDYERAHEQFTEAVRIAPNHCVARLGKGATSYAVGNHADAAKEYEYYVDRCDAEHFSSYERLAKLNETYLSDYPAAVTYYNKLIELTDDEKKKNEYNAMINFLESQIKSTEQKAPEENVDGEEVGAEELEESGEPAEVAEDDLGDEL